LAANVLITHSLTHSLTHPLTHSLTHLLTYLLPYLLTPCSRAILEKLTSSAASQEISRTLWKPKVH